MITNIDSKQDEYIFLTYQEDKVNKTAKLARIEQIIINTQKAGFFFS